MVMNQLLPLMQINTEGNSKIIRECLIPNKSWSFSYISNEQRAEIKTDQQLKIVR
jgi:hypothetical protein